MTSADILRFVVAKCGITEVDVRSIREVPSAYQYEVRQWNYLRVRVDAPAAFHWLDRQS